MRKRRAKANVKVSHSKPPKKFKGRFIQKDGDSSDFVDSDVDSADFYHDEIDDFHNDQEKILLHDDRSLRGNLASKEEEVLPLTDDDDDEEEDDDDVKEEEDETDDDEDQQSIHKSDMESDLEDKSADELPNLDAWGKKKSTYYNADFVDKDWGKSYREEDAEEAKAEEMAAMEMQRNFIANELPEEAFGLDEFMTGNEPVDEKEMETAVRDWSAVSVEDKLKYLRRESPELFVLTDEFKEMVKEFDERIEPLFEFFKDRGILNSGVKYIRLKHSMILHYLMNISFYFMIRSRGSASVKYHPVMKRLSTFRKLLNKLQPVDERMKPEMDYMLEKLKRGEEEEIQFKVKPVSQAEDKATPTDTHASATIPTSKRVLEQTKAATKSKKQKVTDTETEKEVQSLYMGMKKNQRDAKHMSGFDMEDEFQEDEEDYYDEDNELEEFENDGAIDEKRTITYEIAKNKGLVPYRKKEYRNPRVRNRMKYRRAKIRRKGQVREPRREVTRYGGELSGIRTDVTRSIKIK